MGSVDYFLSKVSAGTVTNPVPACAKEITSRYVVNETTVGDISRRSVPPVKVAQLFKRENLHAADRRSILSVKIY